MAAIPVYIVGTITMKSPRGGEVSGSGIEQCVISGLASIEGLGVGGGPITPPEQPPSIWPSPGHPAHPIAPGGPPPGIWPGPGYPAHPIAPGGPPPGIWPGPGPLPHPEHPIVLPLPPDKPPVDPPTEPPQPPGSNWEWVWSPANGWHVGYVPGDKPQPVPPS